VVVGQKLMQVASDIFLAGIKDSFTGIQYHWRQFKDMKGSFDLNSLDKVGLETYLKVCSLCLARALARTGDAPAFWDILAKVTFFMRPLLILLLFTPNRWKAIIGHLRRQ
jgi:hypothetical protein